VRAAADVELGVDAALEVLHPLRADAEKRGDLRDDVPGTGQHDDLEFPVGEALAAGAALALARVPGPPAAHLGQHGGQPVRLGDQRGHAGPAGRGQVSLGRLPVDQDDVQLREAPHERPHPAGHLAEQASSVHDHDVGAAQLAEVDDLIGGGHPAHHGHVRADREASGEGVAEKPLRRLHGDPDCDASGERTHRRRGSGFSAPSGLGHSGV